MWAYAIEADVPQGDRIELSPQIDIPVHESRCGTSRGRARSEVVSETWRPDRVLADLYE